MKPQICICCGQPIAEHDHGLSRNPNVCASCSSMADGMEVNGMEGLAGASPHEGRRAESLASPLVAAEAEVVLDWSAGRVSKSTPAVSK